MRTTYPDAGSQPLTRALAAAVRQILSA